MPTWLFSLQALIIGITAFSVTPRHLLLRSQVVVWTIGVITIMLLFGVEGQTRFYSNDQVLHTEIVRTLRDWTWMPETSPSDARLPYVLPAVLLVFLGVNEILALKTVSLICLLALTHRVLLDQENKGLVQQLQTVFITGCGFIGTFFSLLGLRETMMMLFAYSFITRTSPMVRTSSILFLGLLRPHLAAALLIAEVLVTVLAWTKTPRRFGYAFPPLLMLAGTVIGSILFSVGRGGLRQAHVNLRIDVGIEQIRQIASNFVGLQFLTTGESNINFSIQSLVLLRGIFSETILIPLFFVVVVLLAGSHLERQHQSVLLAFTIYVGVSTNTDFNSFRQNIPFMPLMGIVVLHFFNIAKERESHLRSRRRTRKTLLIAPRGT